MIYTVTFNPSLDYLVWVKDLQMGETNRSSAEEIYPGGKGINVSIVLHNLGMESVALGFCAGFTGEAIVSGAESLGCKTDFIRLNDGLSRINIKLKADEETEINGQGPDISPAALDALFEKLDKLKAGDVLVLAGSIPNTLPADSYERILGRLEGKGVLTGVDATGTLLKNVLHYHPFLIKPNKSELGGLFGVEIRSKDEIAQYARELQKLGARNVLVSMAGEGAWMLTETGEIYSCEAPKGKVKNSVGAGDSMVAGFLTGYLRGGNYREAFRMGVATGSASAFSQGLASAETVQEVLKQVVLL